MPELPEVETMVRGVRDSMVGAVLAEFRAIPCRCKPLTIQPGLTTFAKRIRGAKIIAVERRAKRIVIHLKSDLSIVFEPRMTGLVLLADPPDPDHLRFEFVLKNGRTRRSVFLWDRRGLGTLKLYSSDEIEEAMGPSVLGPDALDITADEFSTRLRNTQRAIKVALLDQKLVAGIGNLYASEMLHEAGIHPEAVASRLSKRRLVRLHAAMNRILLEAIKYEGSTLNDGTYRNALNRDGSYQNKHRVYAKAGQACPTCAASTVQRIVQAQRATFFCRDCQRK